MWSIAWQWRIKYPNQVVAMVRFIIAAENERDYDKQYKAICQQYREAVILDTHWQTLFG
jgi:hypothetical protein